jgi:hypothetical protein
VTKEQKSAAEIANIIKQRIRKPWLRVDIHPAPSGWHAVAVCDEAYRQPIQLRVEKVTSELRALYDLKI